MFDSSAANDASSSYEPTFTDPSTSYQMPGTATPIVLDLAGNGIKITRLTSSSTFFDMTGSGYQNQTAWAGAGNGVLFINTTGKGVLTQANQINFTDWDPTATSDMQALEDVFDTNHNGSLDAGDAAFSNFFVMETNASGTQIAYSLAQLGITSINLTSNNVTQSFSDGSSINGETTFTYANGTTGTAASVTFAYNSQSELVTTTTTTNADGSTTVQNVADNADGSLAYANILNTSADGSTKILTDVDNGGVVTSLQTDVTSINNGVTTETVTNYANGAISANGELTSAGITGDEKLNSTTTTVTNGNVVTISRDQIGGGWTTQQEVQTFTGDALTSDVVSDLNPNGSASNVTTTTTTNGGLTTTIVSKIDGLTADSTTSVDNTVINAPSGPILSQRTETVTNSVGTTVTSLTTTITQTTANAISATITSDLADGLTLNLTTINSTVTNTDGSTTTTQTDYAANGAFLDETVTNLDTTGLLKTTSTDANGAGTAAAPIFNSIVTDDTVVNGDNSRTETVTATSANGTLQSQTITDRAATGPARTVTAYGTGDGNISQTKVVSVDSTGATVDTLSNLNADGSLANQTVTTTSANGLSVTTQIDSTGLTTNGAPIFDHTTTDVTTANDDGSTTETVSDFGATICGAFNLTQTTTSANGLNVTTKEAFGAASGIIWDRLTTDSIEINADGSLTETIFKTDGYGNILETAVKKTSANRETVTTTTTPGVTNLATTVETVAMQANGTVIDTTVHLDQNSDVIGATMVTTSADGLTKITQADIQGQFAATLIANGLTFDQTTANTTIINTDGSRTETISVASKNGSLESQSITTTSANRLSVTTISNPYATPHYATKTTDDAVYNSDGSYTETVTDYGYNGAEIGQTATTTSASGLSITTTNNFDGASVEQATTDVTTLNPNGSRTEVVTDYTGSTNGAVRDITTTTSGIIIAGQGDETTVTRLSNGSVSIYQVETITPAADGSVNDTIRNYASQNGPLLLETVQTTSANGLIKTSSTALNGDTSPDFWTTDTTVFNQDGSTTETVENSNKSGFINETVTTISGNGLVKTIQIDANGATAFDAYPLYGTTVFGNYYAVFNMSITDGTILNSDGGQTETITFGPIFADPIKQTVIKTSADRQTITTERYLDETGTITTVDQAETAQTLANGSTTDTTVSYDADHNVINTVTKTTSGNGLTKNKSYVDGSGTTTDFETDTTTFDANGDGGTLNDVEHIEDVNGTILSSSSKTQTSANGEFVTVTLALTDAGVASNSATFKAVATASTTIDDNGVKTKTVDSISKTYGAFSSSDTKVDVTSANGLSISESTSFSSEDPFIIATSTSNLDGSKTTTSTFYNPMTADFASPTIEDQTIVNTSWDGRTVITNKKSDFDGTNYTVQTNTAVKNADGTETETCVGSGSWGSGAFKVVTNIATNADGSVTTVTQNFNTSDTLISQMVSTVSANGLETATASDATGTETLANLKAAASNPDPVHLPAGMLSTDILSFDQKILIPDGSTTEYDITYYGNPRSKTLTTISANGLVTTKQIDADLNGTYEQVDTTTTTPDGAKTEAIQYYANAGVNAGQLTTTITLTTSADGLVAVLTPATGVTDTTATFANAYGSYQWNRVVSATNTGLFNGSATHYVDANNIDSWSWTDATPSGTSGNITIDLATETQDIAQANILYTTILGHSMTDAQTQYVARYIQNGVLNRNALATALINSQEYSNEYGGIASNASCFSYQINEDFLNTLARLPSISELNQFDPSSMSNTTITTQTVINAALAIAQYATNWTGGGVSSLAKSGQGLAASYGPPVGAAQDLAMVTSNSNGQTEWDSLDSSLSQSNATINLSANSGAIISGSNNVINAANASVTLLGTKYTINGANVDISGNAGAIVTATGAGDIIYANNATITLTAANASYTIEGYGDTILGANGDTLNIIGTGQSAAADIVTINYGTIDIANNSNVVNGNAGWHDVINLGAYDTFASNAYWDTTVAAGTADLITETGSYDNISEVTGDTATINSNLSTIYAPDAIVNVLGQVTTINGDGAEIFQTGTGTSQVIANGANDTIAATGQWNTDVLNGVGDNLADINTASTTVTANGANEILNLNGYGDTLTATGAYDSITLGLHPGTANLNGADENLTSLGGLTVNSTGADDSVTINGANAAANISGVGSSLTETGTGDIGHLNGVNETATDTSTATSALMYSTGASNTITLNGQHDGDTMTGVYDVLSSTGASITIYSEGAYETSITTGNATDVESSGAYANISQSGANDVVHSSGNNAAITISGASCNTSQSGNNDTDTQSGANDWLSDSGSSTIDTLTGLNDYGDDEALNTTINSSGNSDTIRLNLSNETTTDSGANDSVTTYAAGDVITVSGKSDAVISYNATQATPDVVTFDGPTESLIGSYDNITVGSDASVSINAGHSTIIASGSDAITVVGTYDTFSGDVTNSITFSGSTVGDFVSGGAETFDDPIIFAVNGGPVQTVGIDQSAASFDYAGTGQPVPTGWVTPGEGFLVYEDPATAGTPTIIGGYDELDQIAGATSGNLDATNPAWANLALWIDPTGTAQFSPDQLHSLSDLGIASISLSPTTANIDSNGNKLIDIGSYLSTTGVTGQAASVDLAFTQTQPKAQLSVASHA